MAEYQQTVYDIQEVLSLAQTAAPDGNRVRELAKQYGEAVNQVNARLRECAEFLRKGNRDEATRRCKAEPDLLESVAALDFLEREQWLDMLAQSGLPRPASLLTEIAEELNEAFTAPENLSQLLRLHRLCALAHSSLRDRLMLLRQIAKVDADSSFWQDDVALFEKARLEELPREVDSLAKSRDLKALARLDKELRAEGWRSVPPPSLVERVGRLYAALVSTQTHAELTQLAQKLNDAHAALDAATGRKLREAFNARVSVGITQQDDPLLEVVAPAMAWLDEQDARDRKQADFDKKVRALEKGLADHVSETDLERLHDQIPDDPGVPAKLEQRYQDRLIQFESRRKRRQWQIAAAVLAGVVAVSALGWYIIRATSHSRQLEKSAVALEGMIAEENPMTEKYLEHLQQNSPAIYKEPRIQKLRSQWDALMEKDKDRRTAFVKHLEMAQEMAGERSTWESLEKATREIAQARQLEKFNREETECVEAEQKVTQRRQELQKSVDEQFAKQWMDLQARIRKTETSAASSDMVIADISQILTDLESLRKVPRAGEELKAPVAAAITKLESRRSALYDSQRDSLLRTAITRAIGNPDNFTQALEEYRVKFPDTARARAFQEVATQEPALWKGLSRWDAWAQNTSGVNWAVIDPGKAAEIATQADKITEEESAIAPPPALTEILPHLKAVAMRLDESGSPLHSVLRDPLTNPGVADLQCVKTKQGKFYYFLKPPTAIYSTTSFRVVSDLTFREGDYVRIVETDIANPKVDGAYDWTTPQAKFSKFALERLRGLKLESNWEEMFQAILVQLVAEPEMDAVLRVQLMQHIIDAACKGSYCLQQTCKEHLKALESGGIDPSATWVNPNDEAAQKARKAADELLARMPAFQTAGEQAIHVRDNLGKQSLGAEHLWIGWLCKDEDRWVCVAKPGSLQSASGDLVVLHKSGEGSPAELKTIGTAKSTGVELAGTGSAAFKEGRPVFLVKSPKP